MSLIPGCGETHRASRGIFAACATAGLAAFVAFAGAASAQESNASLRGDLAPPAGVSAGGVEIVAVDVDSGYRRNATTRDDGSYQFRNLRPGSYRLEIGLPGGVQRTDVITLRVGQDAELDIDLDNAQVAASQEYEEIVVVAQQVRTLEGGEVGINITPTLIDSLPQNNRNFLAFADLAPGVSFETAGNGATRIQGGAQSSNAVNVFIDGVSQKDYVLKSGITGQDSSPGNPFPQSAIGEYRVITQNYKAEYDQVSSAAITAVTRSGSNDFEGDVFWDFTNESLRSKSPREEELGEEKVDTTDNQFGISLGGPIIPDRLHFFVAYEGKRNEFPVEVSPGAGFTPADLPAEYAALTGVFNREFTEDLYFGKLNYQVTEDDMLEFTAKVRQETGLRWDNGANTPSFTHDINNDETRAMLRWEHASTDWINDLRLTYEDSAWNPQPEREIALFLETASRERILNVGGHPNFQDKGQEGWALQEDFLWTGFEDHSIKTGVKMKWVELKTVQQLPYNAQYSFNTEFDPGSGTGFNDEVPYRVSFGTPLTGVGDGNAFSDNFQFGIYIQDDWMITDRFELSYGIRWDYEETPVYLDFVTPADVVASVTNWSALDNANYDINDFIADGSSRDAFTGAWQPRIGFNYGLTDSYTLFGGFGRSYDRTQFDFISRELAAGTFPTLTFVFDTGDPDNPCPGCPAWDPVYFTQQGRDQLLASAPPGGGGREVFLLDNELDVPYADQFSLGVRGLIGEWQAEFGLSHVRSRDGFSWLLGNRRDDGSFFAPGTVWGPPWGFPPPGLGNLLIGTNGLESDANSAYLKAAKPYDELSGWGLNATYTYMDAEESRRFDEVFSLDYPSLDDYPVLTSAGVRKHRLVVAGNVDLPWGLGLSGKFSYRSPPYVYGVGMPGQDNSQFVPRVIEATDNFKQLDLAVVKYFDVPDIGASDSRLRLRVDILNVFNEENFDSFIGNGASPDFGDVANSGIGGNLPRTYKFSVGYRF